MKHILHVDGDAFFAACEIAHNPSLKGRPVIVGGDKGIACAMSYEAKALGVTRAMPVWKVRQLCPDVVVLPNNFDLYRLYSRRMVSILERYTPSVEAYSIDECFADLTGCDKMLNMSYEQIARAIKKDLFEELGMTFSVGLSVTKVLAKVGSKWQKPDGFKMIALEEIETCLEKVPIAKIWGIGRSNTAYCMGLGIHTAADFIRKTEGYIAAHFDKPLQELWRELRGENVLSVHGGLREVQKSFSDTSTFRPPTSNKNFLLKELSHHTEEVCRHLRESGLYTKRASFFLRKQDLRYQSAELKFDFPVSTAEIIFAKIREVLPEIFIPGVLYRATGVTLYDVVPQSSTQDDLFDVSAQSEKFGDLEKYIDVSVRKRYGKESVVIGSSIEKQNVYRRAKQKNKIYILRKIN